MKTIKFIDLFAGMGGLRLGFEKAFNDLSIKTECIMTSEIKEYAVETLKKNFKQENIVGDVRKVNEKELPDFDFLLGGFPCQAFSYAGNRDGFSDKTRGTLFFEIERILKEKKPYGFILENVEGLVDHDNGRTLKTITDTLKEIGYKVNYNVLDSKFFGVPQSRKRIFIVGTIKNNILLDTFETRECLLKNVLEQNLPTSKSVFSKKLFENYKIEDLYGKSIKDKRGGKNNIHSWDIGLKGNIKSIQKELLNKLFSERRKKKYAEEIDIDWMDGMPLTLNQIKSFFNHKDLILLLEDLVDKKYIVYEYPKKKIKLKSDDDILVERRVYDETKEKGYNIVTGNLSFEFNRILDPNGITPTIVATDMDRLGIIDGKGIRHLSLREGLRLFGYPESYSLDMFDNKKNIRKGFDLLGNTVVVNVVEAVSRKLAESFKNNYPQ